MNRVQPFGIGKLSIRIKISELPKDIREQIIEYMRNHDSNRITESTEEIGILCQTIIPIE